MRKLCKIPARELKPNPLQVRKPRSEAELRALGESVMRHQEVPLIIDVLKTILDGHGRHGGVMLIRPEFELECIQTDENLDASEVQLITAMQRNLQPFEKYRAMMQWKEVHLAAPDAALAERMGITASMVSRVLSLSRCIAAWHEAAEAGRVGISDWSAAAQLDERGQHELLAMKLNGASREVLGAASRKRRSGHGRATVRVNRIKCTMPKGRTVSVSGEGLSLDEAIDAAQEWIRFAKRAVERGWDAKTLERACAAEAKNGA
jgi:hypothetical protein